MGSTSSQSSSLILSIPYPQISNPKVHIQTDLIQESSKKYEVKFPSYLCKDKNNYISFCQRKQDIPNKVNPAYQIIMPDVFTIVLLQTHETIQNKLWKMLSEGETTQLKLLDRLRMGQVQLSLKELVFDQKQEPDLFSYRPKCQKGKKQQKCRICFEGQQQEGNPLICLCKCEGTVKNTHFKCLKHWQQKSIKEIKTINCNEYEYNPLICDICKQEIPISFFHKSKRYSFIQMDQLSPPYAIFETQIYSKRTKLLKSYRIKLCQGMSLLIGRSNESQISLHNSTISRKHCKLYYTNKKLYAKDLGSKYGTMYHSHDNQINFSAEDGLIFGIENSLMQLKCEEKDILSVQFPQFCLCPSSHEMTLKIGQKQNTQSERSKIFSFF